MARDNIDVAVTLMVALPVAALLAYFLFPIATTALYEQSDWSMVGPYAEAVHSLIGLAMVVSVLLFFTVWSIRETRS